MVKKTIFKLHSHLRSSRKHWERNFSRPYHKGLKGCKKESSLVFSSHHITKMPKQRHWGLSVSIGIASWWRFLSLIRKYSNIMLIQFKFNSMFGLNYSFSSIFNPISSQIYSIQNAIQHSRKGYSIKTLNWERCILWDPKYLVWANNDGNKSMLTRVQRWIYPLTDIFPSASSSSHFNHFIFFISLCILSNLVSYLFIICLFYLWFFLWQISFFPPHHPRLEALEHHSSRPLASWSED